MNNFKDILKNSVNGSYCVYILLIADTPANLISLGVSYFNRITANIITLSSFSLSLLSASFAINGDFFISSILFYASFLLDFVDGKIARLRNEASSFGKKLDMFVDRFGFMLISLICSATINLCSSLQINIGSWIFSSALILIYVF